ncbi:MAG: haloacid dehalogenase-like hydrolase, partial [Gammaproteobacteria bacterium]|nr:haloacid dehalogenase-like hydrolase [Gammaproteobacteria bacterium]
MSDQEQYKSPDVPLYVSLDGALIKSDIDFELFFALLARSFTFLFLAPIWLLKGKANFKQQIALRTDLDPALLPYNQKFLRYLREQKKSGRTIILITAANKIYAQKIANHLDLFDEVLASDEQSILYDDRKAASIQSKQGTHEFDYVGNAQTDKNTWRYA